MVTFTRVPYKQCLEMRQKQDQILKVCRWVGCSIVGLYLIKKFATFTTKLSTIQSFVKATILKNYS